MQQSVPGVVVVASAGGAVLDYLLSAEGVAGSLVRLVVSDRACGALDVARSHNCDALLIPSASGLEFSDQLHRRISPRSAFLSFYTKLFRGRFVVDRAGFVINAHPSLLPAFPGADGFGDTLASTAKFMGATLHQVDEGVDTGCILSQAALPIDRERKEVDLRHEVYIAQTYLALQFSLWVRSGRFSVRSDGKAVIRGLVHAHGAFSPVLDPECIDVIRRHPRFDDLEDAFLRACFAC